MKKDIEIPQVENIFFAAVQEWNDDFMDKVWTVYLVNDSDYDIENVLIVSRASGSIDGESKKTSLLRHVFLHIPAVSVMKVEILEKTVLLLQNEFMLTYFIGDRLYDKKYVFNAQTITPDYVEEVPILFVDGVIVR